MRDFQDILRSMQETKNLKLQQNIREEQIRKEKMAQAVQEKQLRDKHLHLSTRFNNLRQELDLGDKNVTQEAKMILTKYILPNISPNSSNITFTQVVNLSEVKALEKHYPNFWAKYQENINEVNFRVKALECSKDKIQYCKTLNDMDQEFAKSERENHKFLSNLNNNIREMTFKMEQHLRQFFQFQEKEAQYPQNLINKAENKLESKSNSSQAQEQIKKLQEDLAEREAYIAKENKQKIKKDEESLRQGRELSIREENSKIREEANAKKEQELREREAKLIEAEVDHEKLKLATEENKELKNLDSEKATKIEELMNKLFEASKDYDNLKTEFEKYAYANKIQKSYEDNNLQMSGEIHDFSQEGNNT